MKVDYSQNANKNVTDLVIYQKYLELIYYSNDITRKYPKSENFCLVQEIKGALYRWPSPFNVWCKNI